MKLSKETNALLLAAATDAAAPYIPLVARIGAETLQAKAKAKEASAQRNTVWGMFREALAIASEAGHSAGQLRVGLEVACAQQEIPGGSVRSYIATVSAMFADVQAGTLSAEDAGKMTITDARERYPSDPVKAARNALIRKLTDAVKTWDDADVENLIAQVEAVNAEAAEKAKESENGTEAQQREAA